MKLRHAVYEGAKPFAFVHATSTEDAVRIGCMKTDGHEPKACWAVVWSGCTEAKRRQLKLDWARRMKSGPDGDGIVAVCHNRSRF